MCENVGVGVYACVQVSVRGRWCVSVCLCSCLGVCACLGVCVYACV